MTMAIGTEREQAILEGDLNATGCWRISGLMTAGEIFGTPWMDSSIHEQRFCCYGLVRCRRVIYVGRSANVRGRVGQHASSRNQQRKDFDSGFLIDFRKEASMIWWESCLIDVLRPDWNAAWGQVMIRRLLTEQAVALLCNSIEDLQLRAIFDSTFEQQTGRFLVFDPDSLENIKQM
jgi:hypothetical protein